jgi:hypothetical protein
VLKCTVQGVSSYFRKVHRLGRMKESPARMDAIEMMHYRRAYIFIEEYLFTLNLAGRNSGILVLNGIYRLKPIA